MIIYYANQSIMLKQLIIDHALTPSKITWKKTWKTIKSILNNDDKNTSFQEYFKDERDTIITDTKEIANRFNKFFTNIGSDLAKKNYSGTKNHKTYLDTPINKNFNFTQVTVRNVNDILESLPSKTSSGYDGLSLKLLKSIKHIILEPLTLIINQMINTGIFPDKLKIVKAIPIYKKGDEAVFSNYRPISLLPLISKVFEKVIFKQLYSYFKNEKIFNAGQYGFKSGHSTELAVLEIIDRITIDMDNGKISINIYLDLSKAFDTLDHSILIDKLKHYGIRHKSISLLKSYLSHRKQYVTWNDTDSQYNSINTGVPQGSILGPLLFIIYINDFSKASELFDFIMYADETT